MRKSLVNSITIFQKITQAHFNDLIVLPYPLFREIQETRLKIEDEIKKQMEKDSGKEVKTISTGLAHPQ